MGLLLPALHSAREAARRTTCRNDLRQLGIALHAHHDRHGVFPPGVHNEWSWISHLLPDLEQNNLYAQLDFEKEPFESANSAYMASTVPVMLCPSDPHADSIHVSEFTSMGFARTNYLGTEDTGEPPSGMLGYDGTNSFRDVVDGTSQTMFVGERGVDAAGEYGWWAWDPILGATPPFRRGDAEEAKSMEHFWSYHPGGAHFLFVDGSIHFLSYSIEDHVFAALGSKDGGETMPTF